MAAYRLSRAIEASIIDYLVVELAADGWNGIRVEKAFSQAYEGELPCIVVNVSSRPDTRRELGTDTLSKFVNIEVRIFATSDGNRLDLADYLLEKIMPGIDYYEYTITNGVVSDKDLKGRINILEITTNRKELANTNAENLVKEDKFRQLMSFRCRIATTV